MFIVCYFSIHVFLYLFLVFACQAYLADTAAIRGIRDFTKFPSRYSHAQFRKSHCPLQISKIFPHKSSSSKYLTLLVYGVHKFQLLSSNDSSDNYGNSIRYIARNNYYYNDVNDIEDVYTRDSLHSEQIAHDRLATSLQSSMRNKLILSTSYIKLHLRSILLLLSILTLFTRNPISVQAETKMDMIESSSITVGSQVNDAATPISIMPSQEFRKSRYVSIN